LTRTKASSIASLDTSIPERPLVDGYHQDTLVVAMYFLDK
jgi:hypothetical protein